MSTGVEFICLDFGSGFALSSGFDEAREIVLGKKAFNGYLLTGTNKEPIAPRVMYMPVVDKDEKLFTVFVFDYMFVKIVFDMERRVTLFDNKAEVMGLTVFKF